MSATTQQHSLILCSILLSHSDREDPGNYRGITLLSVVGKVFCKIVNDRLVRHLESGVVLHEGQAGFRAKRSCVDNIYVLSELVQGRLREGKKTYADVLIRCGVMVSGLRCGS